MFYANHYINQQDLNNKISQSLFKKQSESRKEKLLLKKDDSLLNLSFFQSKEKKRKYVDHLQVKRM